ncbi:hypothetical protein V6S67_01960 [Arthrobacter sp. Soc17.1.1.1]|uniref:hypothetical protein n=1 Tax=Arthrobacter sp. Soc17.1.1.1 TaxID=3121277 RepID=UPI002FE452EB
MTPDNHTQNRALQQDAHAWADFTGCNYTTALNQIQDPLAQGFLGDRISARELIDTLTKHDILAQEGDEFVLGELGFGADSEWNFNQEDDFVQLALITDMLRMFTRLPGTESPEIGSYTLKHTGEAFLKGTPAKYVTNGRLIWAAAALGLPIAEYEKDGEPNLLIGIPENEHSYVFKSVRSGQTRPQAHHFRPPGYEHLRTAIAQVLAGEPAPERWTGPETGDTEPAPFHNWLLAQTDQNNVVGDFARDYAEGIQMSMHRIAHTADELLVLLSEIQHSPEAYNSARSAIGEWLDTLSPSPGVRTLRISRHSEDSDGYGAGSGSVSRLNFLCPCGDGRIVEEHENIPGFREHDVVIDCPKCRDEWRFLDGRTVADWALEPVF